MAVIAPQSNDADKNRSFYQDCFMPNTLAALRPSTNSETIFRPIPEVDAKGNFLPMVRYVGPGGENDYSNITLEEVIIAAGRSELFNGLCRASDSDATDPVNMVFPSLFIKLRGREKKEDLPENIKAVATQLLQEREVPGSKIRQRYLPRSTQVGFIQGVALKVNGKQLDKPATRQALVLPTSLLMSVDNMLKDAIKRGIDVFSATEGYCIVVSGLPPDRSVGRTVSMFKADLGAQMPLPEARVRELWVPWEKAFKRMTTDQQILKAIRCFGRDIVEYIFPDDVARLAPLTAVGVPVSQPIAAQHAAPPVKQSSAAPASRPAPVLDLGTGQDELVTFPPEDDAAPTTAQPAAKPRSMSSAPATAADLAQQYSSLLKSI